MFSRLDRVNDKMHAGNDCYIGPWVKSSKADRLIAQKNLGNLPNLTLVRASKNATTSARLSPYMSSKTPPHPLLFKGRGMGGKRKYALDTVHSD